MSEEERDEFYKKLEKKHINSTKLHETMVYINDVLKLTGARKHEKREKEEKEKQKQIEVLTERETKY